MWKPVRVVDNPRQEAGSMRMHLLVAVACLMSVPLNAQWLNHPSRGVPRMPTASPIFPHRRRARPDGKPDFSGIWQLEPDAPCPALGCQVGLSGRGSSFAISAQSFPGGSLYQPWAAARRQGAHGSNWERTTRSDSANLAERYESSLSSVSEGPSIPRLVVILSERDVTYRQLFLDGRPLPPDPDPTSTGIRPDAGTVTCWWCKRMDCAGGCGSIGTGVRSARRRR